MTLYKQIKTKYPNSQIAEQIFGIIPIDEKLIKTYEEFDDIYRIRHDIINLLICQKKNLPFGEKEVGVFLTENKIEITNTKYSTLVLKQTPDVLCFIDGLLYILEISVSVSLTMELKKHSKYSLLSFFLKQNHIPHKLDVIVINPDRVLRNRPELIHEHKLDEIVIEKMHEYCLKARELINKTRSTPNGKVWYLTRNKLAIPDQEIKYSLEDVIKIQNESQNKVVHDEKDILKLLNGNPQITMEDEAFITYVYSFMNNTESKMIQHEEFDEEKFLSSLKPMGNTDERRSIFPLPYFALKNIDSALRSTEDDINSLGKVSSFMEDCGDQVLSLIGSNLDKHLSILRKKEKVLNEDFLFVCKISQEMRSVIALEGPGRKSYVLKGSEDHIRMQNKRKLYSLNYHVNVDDVGDLSWIFSAIKTDEKIEERDFNDHCENLSNLNGVGLDYAKIVQSIYREININSMRGDRRHNFIMKPTGVEGVFVLLYKGPKIRCGELANLVWFKVIILVDNLVQSDQTINDQYFKKLNISKGIAHSGWLSCDTHRLDHYIRCYDKIIMAYLCTVNNMYRSDWQKNIEKTKDLSLKNLLKKDESNLLGCIIMTYLEDRRSTSKMLQYVRYLVMTSISLFPYYNSVMEKIIEPIRSPLQLYFLKQMISYIHKMKKFKIYQNYQFGTVKYDTQQKIFKDILGGASLKLPHPLLSDRRRVVVDFTEVLSEMYFCMLFNKNQDDPTHASFQILTKMLEGEVSMSEMKGKGFHLGYRNDMDDFTWAHEVIKNPHMHKFSARAIEVGAKLLRSDQGDLSGTEIVLAKNSKNLNKTLDQFATYKSSSTVDTLRFDENKKRQNPRRRCIEGVFEEIKKKNFRSFDVAISSKDSNLDFQVFKKNQIGGVREILILPINSRITLNILETLSRNICKYVPSEILTHGVEKNESLRDSLFEIRKKPYKSMAMFYSFDKSKWGPSFVPIQFYYMFKPFISELGSFAFYILHTLIKHQNKRCFYPDRLINAWVKDPDNLLKHNIDHNLQKMKEKFLLDKQLFFVNESNMGQGILHYTSSYLHACLIAFRNQLYRRYCDDKKLQSDDHKDLFSSDDSFTVQAIEVSNINNFKLKLKGFLIAQEISERLFNCQTSKSKSSINPLIGEFNSLFLSNLTFYPTTLKFAVASVHPFNTDSFYRMVKESYISSRMIIENGGSLELYTISHHLNKRYCESIYHTGQGQFNDFRTNNIKRIPFHLGYYPIFEPTLMLMFGPEYYNYSLYKQMESLSVEEKSIFKKSHLIAKVDLEEALTELMSGDAMLGSLIKIEAKVGPIRQLTRIQNNSPMSRQEIRDLITQDPLIIIKKPQKPEEILYQTCQKLYVVGASEALKSICPSIYYGRVSATVSANAFCLSNHRGTITGDSKTFNLKTYKECFDSLLQSKDELTNMEEQIKFLYPSWFEYDQIDRKVIQPILGNLRSALEIQTIRKLSFHKIHTKLYNQVFEIFDKFWNDTKYPESDDNKFQRDWEIIKSFYPLIKDSIEETMDLFKGEKEQKIIGVCMLILKIYSLKDKTFKGIIFGPPSSDIISSAEILTKYNYMTSRTYDMPLSQLHVSGKKPIDYNDIYFAHNSTVMACMTNKIEYDYIKIEPWERINIDAYDIFMMDPAISKSIKKRVLICLIHAGILGKLEIWTERTSTILHHWNKRQKFDKEQKIWIGDFDLSLICGRKSVTITYDSYHNQHYILKTDFDDPKLLYDFILEASSLLQYKTVEEFIKIFPKGSWILDKENSLITKIEPKLGFNFNRDSLIRKFEFDDCSLIIKEDQLQLVDYSYRKMMAVMLGFLNCPHQPSFKYKWDITYEGMSYRKMIDVGAFSQTFEILQKTKEETLNLIEDFRIDKPSVFVQTRDLLHLSKDWKIRSDIDEKKKDELEIAESSDLMSEFMRADFLDTGDVKRIEDVFKEESNNLLDLNSFSSDLVNESFIFSTKTETYTTFSKKIYNNVINLKSFIICHQLLNKMQINIETISSILRLLKNQDDRRYIGNALILYYDTLYHGSDALNKNVVMDININFFNKFFIKTYEMTDFIE